MKYALILTAALAAAPAFANSSEQLRAAYVGLDENLNEVYRTVMSQRGAADQQLVRNDQRAWITKRNKKCGSPDKPVTDSQVMCLGEMTLERIDVLRALRDGR